MIARKEQPLPENTPKLLLDYDQAGAMLGVSKKQIGRMVADNRLPVVKVGRLRRISLAALEAWVARESKYEYERITPNLLALRKR